MSVTEDSKDIRCDSPHGRAAAAFSTRKWLASLGVVAAVLTGVTIAIRHVSETMVWERFDTVKPGVLYRSGQLSTDQLRDAIDRYGIRTVVNFQVRDRTLAAEEALVQSMGMKFVDLPMPGDGFGEEEQFREFLKLVDDPANRPVLIHCAAGTCRTGAAVALYRFERDGWSIDDVADEMRRQAYDTGWISGYVFKMLKNKPHTAFRDETGMVPQADRSGEESAEPVAANPQGSEAELRR